MDDYIATVEEVLGDRMSVIYRQGERDPVGVTIELPDDHEPTRAEIIELIEAHAGQALHFWDQQRREENLASRKDRLQAALGNIRVSGTRQPIDRTGGLPDVVEL